MYVTILSNMSYIKISESNYFLWTAFKKVNKTIKAESPRKSDQTWIKVHNGKVFTFTEHLQGTFPQPEPQIFNNNNNAKDLLMLRMDIGFD